ncbi:MAG: hypothetical protein ABR521_07535 [Gaiellaceae bacterium]
MRLTRKQLLAGAGASALGAAGIYELVDRLTGAAAPRPGGVLRPEQHLLDGLHVIEDDGVEVVVIPLHHQVVTARLRVAETRRALAEAHTTLERALRTLERRFEPTPAGLGVTVAWGLPYFRRYVPKLAAAHLPIDRRASAAKGREVRVLIDAIRFPSDPDKTVLEENDVAVLLRSDDRDHVAEGARALFEPLGSLFELTSIRKGFVGGGFSGRRSLPKRMAMAAGVPGAELIPETSQLFLGFTSTQRAGLGPTRIANIETLGFAATPVGYFRQGTHMHLSHVFEDLEAWYVDFDHAERVATTFRPRGLEVRPDQLTVRQDPEDVVGAAENERDFRELGAIGHSAAIMPSSRLLEDVRGTDGTLYPKGTAIPQRADFNTLDNPFFWTSEPDLDRFEETPRAGLHFVTFNPTSDDFHRNRLAMDGVLPDGTTLRFEARARGQGLNSVLRTTHRQNFLVPPRRHRSFPLAELLA